LVAIACALAGLATHQPFPSPRLGVVDAPSLIPDSVWTGPRVMIGVAAILGLVVAGIARWGGSGRFGMSMAGFAGPALVAAAYLIAGPGTSTDRTAQAEPYVAALIAVAAGLIASVLIAMPGRRVSVSLRPERNFDDLRPLTGDVVSPPGRPGPGGRPRRGERPAYSGAGAGPRAAERDRATYPGADPQSQRPGGGTGWDADTWPGFHTGGGGRHTDPDEALPYRTDQGAGTDQAASTGFGAGSEWRVTQRHSSDEAPADPHSGSAAAYPGGTYASGAYESATVTGAMPTMGQPLDPHESWLRDLGQSGRHSSDDGHP
jgi:hypothetical protein